MKVDESVETKEKSDVEEKPVEENVEEEAKQPVEETMADDSKTDANMTDETVEAKEDKPVEDKKDEESQRETEHKRKHQFQISKRFSVFNALFDRNTLNCFLTSM